MGDCGKVRGGVRGETERVGEKLREETEEILTLNEK